MFLYIFIVIKKFTFTHQLHTDLTQTIRFHLIWKILLFKKSLPSQEAVGPQFTRVWLMVSDVP